MVNKTELAKVVSKENNITQAEALKYINSIFNEIENSLKNEEDVNIAGFGVFRSVLRKKRIATNPKTSEQFELPERRVASFYLGKRLKEMYKNKTA